MFSASGTLIQEAGKLIKTRFLHNAMAAANYHVIKGGSWRTACTSSFGPTGCSSSSLSPTTTAIPSSNHRQPTTTTSPRRNGRNHASSSACLFKQAPTTNKLHQLVEQARAQARANNRHRHSRQQPHHLLQQPRATSKPHHFLEQAQAK